MDGKPLYEYARNNIPLPRPIEARRCEIPEIRMVKWEDGGSHPYRWPTSYITSEDRVMFDKLHAMVNEKGITKPQALDHSNHHHLEPESVQALGPKRSHSPDLGPDDLDSSHAKKAKTEDPSPDLERLTSSSLPTDPITTDLKTPSSPRHEESPSKELEKDEVTLTDNGLSPAFTLEMTVSSGTYVRTIVQ